MSRKFSLAHLTALKCPPPELIRLAGEAGYDYVGIRPIYMGTPGEPNYALYSQPDMLRDTLDALDSTGVRVHDIEVAMVNERTDVASLEPAFEIAARLGAQDVIASVWTDDLTLAIDKFGRVCESAAHFGLYVDLEFVTWASIQNLYSASFILWQANAGNAGLLIDTLHAYRSRLEPEMLESLPRKWFRFMHICDGPAEIPDDKAELIKTGRYARLYVGEGAVPVRDYVRSLPGDAVLSLELPNAERIERLGPAGHIRRCLETAKAVLG